MIQYTMVIADDEEIERKALRLLVQKEFPEIEIVALVSNGTDLVEQAQKWRPDIAIVDVNMPGINGIDAIDLLCARGVHTRYIINTAYDEFEYVQRALALKIDAYILKPEKRDVTIATIRKICRQIDEERSSNRSQMQIRELFVRIQPVMESEIMYSLFIGEPAVDSFNTYCEMHAVRFEGGAVVALVPVIGGSNGLRSQDKAVLRAALDAAFGNSCFYLASVTESNICLLLFVPSRPEPEQRRWIADVLRVAVDKLNHSLHLPLRAGVGGVYSRFDQMGRSYQESLLSLVGTQGDDVVFYRREQEEQADRVRTEAELLVSLAREGNLQRIGYELNRLAPGLRQDTAKGSALWKVSQELLGRTAQENASLHTQLERTTKALEQPDADSAALLREGFYRIAALLDKKGGETEETYVQQALRYIEENYASEISLDTVAGQIGISPFYLSRLFKSEQGETFVECLTRVRMAAAVRLAKETRLSIREIAERTGYSNPTYFCRVFKKRTGSTIGDLREKARKKRF
ncbi:MAG TPA: response regulator [Candidatus Pygmaiobacter gallistercoris]|nr:response regulator [Candidatus Pygmaiobacter gallistercoris]